MRRTPENGLYGARVLRQVRRGSVGRVVEVVEVVFVSSFFLMMYRRMVARSQQVLEQEEGPLEILQGASDNKDAELVFGR